MYGNVYQIYFNDESRKNCLPYFMPYDNTPGSLTPFFENTVIYNMLKADQHMAGGWFGVLSHAFQFKARGAVTGVTKKFLDEALEKGPDVLTFNRHEQSKNSILKGARFHGDGFMRVFEILFPDYDLKMRMRHIVYSNYVIGTADVWERYKAFFLPLYERMRDEDELNKLLWVDSRYKKKLPQAAAIALGVNYYPLHTFVCERFWSIFLNMNRDINAIHY